MSVEAEQDDVVRREIELDGDRERVWAHVADPAELATWLADEVALDVLEPGAEGLVRTGDELRAVVVDEVEPARRLALRWRTLPDGEERLVELTLHDVAGRDEDGDDPTARPRTRLVVVELPWAAVRAVGPAVQTGLPSWGPTMLAA